MARVEITIPGERITEEFTALVTQPVSPSTAVPTRVGLVEISQQQPTELIPGPMGPQGPRGSRWFTGAGDPTVPGGVIGDMYLDDVSGAVWAWDGTAWVNTGTNIQGSPDTGPQILAKLAPVDGAGSGLDADLLDGQHGAYYLDWDNHTDKPATFPPTLPIPWSGLSGVPATFPPSAHNQDWTTITGKPATYPPTLPIAQSDVTGLVAGQAAQDSAIALKLGEAPQDGLTYGRKNATWATIVGGAVISDTPPPGPLTPGQLWWESDTGNTYLWFDDGDTQQWVQQNIQPAAVPSDPPLTETNGTFTPVLSGTTTAGVGTYSSQGGNWRRHGSLIFFELGLTWSAHTGTGNMVIDGLPFPAVSTVIFPLYASGLTFTGSPIAIIVGTAQIILRTVASGAGATAIPMDTAAQINISGTYRVA